jgi:hypothetical protein
MQSLVQMRNSNTFSHISYNYIEKRSAVDDFVLIESENQQIRRELDSMEQVFSQTDTEFFKAAQEQIHQTTEFEQYRL